MTWAGERRFIIACIVGAFLIFILALILVPTFYQSPSCTDRSQNQGEQGIDCGGPCQYLCNALLEPPIVRFTKAIGYSNGRVDIVAYVDNPNVKTAARTIPYTVTLYAADHTVLKQSTGSIDLLPSTSVPLYLPAFYTGRTVGVQAFVTIDPEEVKWFTLTRDQVLPTVANPTLKGTTAAPRVSVTLSNPATVTLYGIKVIAIVYDAKNNVVGASQTVVSSIGAQQNAEAVFTWSEPFASTPARIEIIPSVSLGS